MFEIAQIFNIFVGMGLEKITAIEILDDLYESGKLRQMVNAGLISINIIIWRKVWHAHQLQIENGSTKFNAVKEVSDVFDISERQIYRILKNLRTDG